MESNWTELFVASLLGGLFGGGFIMGWIELQRLRRQKRKWNKEDQKVVLTTIQASYTESIWDASFKYFDESEKLRIYDTGLHGKIKDWNYFVKISIKNVSSEPILITSYTLEVSQPTFEEPSRKKEFENKYTNPRIVRYDLIEKRILEQHDFPIALPANSTTGVVYLAEIKYDYPQLVSKIPTEYTFILTLDDKEKFPLKIQPEKKTYTYELDIFYDNNGEVLWEDYATKNDIEPLPF